jgi:hypothetical protein
MNAPGATEEVDFKSSSGYMALVFMFIASVAIPLSAVARFPPGLVLAVLAFVFLAKGMYILQPNQSALMMLFGSYRGTDYSTGLRWANPFLNKKKVSLPPAQLQQRKAQGERQAWQPDRDRGGRGVEGERHGAAVLDIDNLSSTSRSRQSRRCAISRTSIPTITSKTRKVR